MAGERAKGAKKNRKFSRNVNSPSMKRYRAEARWEKNRKRRIARHVRSHPGDLAAARNL